MKSYWREAERADKSPRFEWDILMMSGSWMFLASRCFFVWPWTALASSMLMAPLRWYRLCALWLSRIETALGKFCFDGEAKTYAPSPSGWILLRPRNLGGLKLNLPLLSPPSPSARRPPYAGVSEKPSVFREVIAFLFLDAPKELASKDASKYALVGLFSIALCFVFASFGAALWSSILILFRVGDRAPSAFRKIRFGSFVLFLSPKMPSLYFSVLSLLLNASYFYSKLICCSIMFKDLPASARASAPSTSWVVGPLPALLELSMFNVLRLKLEGEPARKAVEFRLLEALGESNGGDLAGGIATGPPLTPKIPGAFA